jgi:chloramphenicol-sensitive protein RarD
MGQVDESAKPNVDTPAGVAYGLAAYIWWGVIPPYVALMKVVPAVEILAHRIVLATGFLLLYLAAIGRFPEVGACLRDPKRRNLLLLSSTIVGVNWFIFILSVTTGHAKEGSLGYFISPLFNVVLGALIFRENLRRWQKVAISIAATAVLTLVVQTGAIPWIALGLALTWSVYSAIRRVTPVDGVLGLTIESIFLSPVAATYLIYLTADQLIGFSSHGLWIALLVQSTGIVMTVPMVFFGQAARKLRLTTLGFLQYISPTIQFVLAITIMGEELESNELPGYLLVWIALAVYIADMVRALRQSKRSIQPVSMPE